MEQWDQYEGSFKDHRGFWRTARVTARSSADADAMIRGFGESIGMASKVRNSSSSGSSGGRPGESLFTALVLGVTIIGAIVRAIGPWLIGIGALVLLLGLIWWVYRRVSRDSRAVEIIPPDHRIEPWL
jgi:hypothetical protein